MKMEATPTNRSRLHFRDFLIMPIQRICRYPLLLHSLLISSASTPPERAYERPILSGSEKDLTSSSGSPSGSATGSRRPSTDFDVGVDVERALGAMRSVAEEADEARRLQEAEIKSATVLERLELHTVLTPTFLRSLGTCRLIGSLDVLHHHPVVAPLIAPAKVNLGMRRRDQMLKLRSSTWLRSCIEGTSFWPRSSGARCMKRSISCRSKCLN